MPKLKRADMSNLMTEHDFMRLTLIANVDSVLKIICDQSQAGEIKTTCAKMRRDIKRIENLIPGKLLPDTAIGSSARFYMDMQAAVARLIRSFKPFQPRVARDAKGRWCKI